jgi:signal transduction histidine kinase/CheY-like chemotaxis protein
MEQRILIYAPTGQDAGMTAQVLAGAGLRSHICKGLGELQAALADGAGAVLTVEETLPHGAHLLLLNYLAHQPEWSDLPIVLLAHRGADSSAVRQAVGTLGNVSLLERPVRTRELIATVHTVLRARRKQYQVREAARRKDEFLASLGHELRNPLAPIRTSVALLAHLYPDAPQPARIRDTVERQVRLLTRLVDDLLDVARITSGKIKLQYQTVTLGAVMRHVDELCQQAAQAKKIHIDWALPETPVNLYADYSRVVQICANILSNAIKFTPPGGAIAVTAQHRGNMLQVRIRDNGIGLEPETIPRIFRMFEQNPPGNGQIASGLGIGLSLSREFAQMHGGTIKASSEGLGKGSEFVIDLPIVCTAEAPAAKPQPAAPPRQQHVLVVDDNHDAADSLAALLDIEGFEVRTAYDGAAAVQAAQHSMPDLVLMDLGMPGMDGCQTARAIRALPGSAGVQMIALTGWGQTDARRRTLEAGFNQHLVKPVELEQLLALASPA